MDTINAERPRISLIILAYNRAHLVGKAVESVLRQSFQDFELIIVDNGSEDDTAGVLRRYEGHGKVRLFRLPENRGFKGGMNFAFDQIRGEWFSSIGDDDELLPEAFETLLRVLDEVDPAIDAITCNGIDTAAGRLSGRGLDKSQYLPLERIVGKASGNFWGITRTELLGGMRFNEKLPGHESALWFRIDAVANRYYIHKPLKIWRTGHGPTETASNRKPDPGVRARMYRELLNEPFYLEALRKYNRKRYLGKCLRGMLFLQAAGDEQGVKQYRRLLGKGRPGWPERLAAGAIAALQPQLACQVYQALAITKTLKPKTTISS